MSHRIAILTKVKTLAGRPQAFVIDGMSYQGIMAEEPRSGEPFYLALTEGTVNGQGTFATSKVLNVVNDEQNIFIFETSNSQYRLEILPHVH